MVCYCISVSYDYHIAATIVLPPVHREVLHAAGVELGGGQQEQSWGGVGASIDDLPVIQPCQVKC